MAILPKPSPHAVCRGSQDAWYSSVCINIVLHLALTIGHTVGITIDDIAVSPASVSQSLVDLQLHHVTSLRVLQAQYNAPIADLGTAGVPAYRVRVACDYLGDDSLAGSELVSAMAEALEVFTANASYANGCLDITGASAEPEPEPPGAASAPASYIAAFTPAAAPAASTTTAAEPELSSGQKFSYQVCVCAHAALKRSA